MMCHSNANAEEFYTADMDFQQAFEVRADLADDGGCSNDRGSGRGGSGGCSSSDQSGQRGGSGVCGLSLLLLNKK